MSDPMDRRDEIAPGAETRRRQDVDATTAFEREVDLRERAGSADEYEQMRLLPDEVVNELSPRWSDVQASFVDEPRRAVEQADELVADAVERLQQAFAQARSSLERDWDRGEDVSTEDLRQAFRRYRTFFDRLLQI